MAYEVTALEIARQDFNEAPEINPPFDTVFRSAKNTAERRHKRRTTLRIAGIALAVGLAAGVVSPVVAINLSSAPFIQLKSGEAREMSFSYLDDNPSWPVEGDKDIVFLRNWDEFALYVNSHTKRTASDLWSTDCDYTALSSKFFETADLCAVRFYCSSIEANQEKNYDGVGPKLEKANILSSKGLALTVSVPTFGYDEAILADYFFIGLLKEDTQKIKEYSLEVFQRDTGEKGSAYYNENGERK
jgi:hypothetical protein